MSFTYSASLQLGKKRYLYPQMVSTAIILASIFALVQLAYSQPPRAIGRGSDSLNPLPPPPPSGARPSGARPSGLRIRSVPSTDPECLAATTRNVTGRCTSEVNPILGEARFAQSSIFSRSVDAPDFSGLSSAREISNIISNQVENTRNYQRLNDLFTIFGQFIDHDFALSPANLSAPMPIEVPQDDPFLTIPELEFLRSNTQESPAGSGVFVPITTLSSALDLNQVYGSDLERNAFLRVPHSCRLRTSDNELPPFNIPEFVNSPSNGAEFFLAGDTRISENPILTSLHIIFLREHNRICDILESSFTGFSAEKMYESARAINIAQYQKIVYNEWLPTILGSQLPAYTDYNSRVDPTVSIEFTTAGFRLGHTLVSDGISRINSVGARLPIITAEEMFFRPSDLKTGEVEEFVRGAAMTCAQEVDVMVVNALRNFLFNTTAEFDLIALNIQRGRDHGVRFFNDIREILLGSRARSFSDITKDGLTAERLQEAYENVDKVEAWPGLMAEDKESGSGLGSTVAEMWKREFIRLRDGDRFFYLRPGNTQIPAEILSSRPDINSDIFGDTPIFRRIILRTTLILGSQLQSGSEIFRAY